MNKFFNIIYKNLYLILIISFAGLFFGIMQSIFFTKRLNLRLTPQFNLLYNRRLTILNIKNLEILLKNLNQAHLKLRN